MLLKLFKKLVPTSNNLKEVDSVVTWQVRWNSLRQSGTDSEYVSWQKEVAVFFNKDVAKAFKESLEQAFKLLKYRGSNSERLGLTTVIIEEVRT